MHLKKPFSLRFYNLKIFLWNFINCEEQRVNLNWIKGKMSSSSLLALVLLFFCINFCASEIGTNQPSYSLRFFSKITQDSSEIGPNDAVIIVDHGSSFNGSNISLSRKSLMKLFIWNWKCFSFGVYNVVLFMNFS